MLQIKDIRKEYKTGDLIQRALDGVSLTLRDNEFVAVLGPSGSGKTTLLNIIGGLDHYDSGDLVVNGISTKEYHERDWDAYRNHTIGFVFQSYNLIPHQTVLANVELALTISGVSRSDRKERAAKALEAVGLGDQMHKKPTQMSGGQMQRVAIARALVNEPDIILADEPTGALDSETSIQIMELLKEVASDKLVIMVTHNPELAEKYATRIISLKDGRIIADSDPEAGGYQLQSAVAPHRTKLCFRTALGLSLNNLMTKKGRTILTAFAGAIGIIGIALIMSLSNGMNDYISSVESDIMGSYPIQLEKETIDITSMMESAPQNRSKSEGNNNSQNKIYSSNIVGDTIKSSEQMIKENDLGKFKRYLDKNMNKVKNNVAAVEYGYDITPQVFRQDDGEYIQVSPASLLSESSAPAAMPMSQSTSTAWSQLVSDKNLRESQYTLLAGDWPSDYDEVALVVTENNEVSDFVLYTLGIMDIDRMNDIIEAVENDDEYNDPKESFQFEDIIGKEYQVFAPCEMYVDGGNAWVDKTDEQDHIASIFGDGITVKVTCVLQADESAEISSGIAYNSKLTEKLMDITADSSIVKDQLSNPDTNVLTGEAFEDDDDESSGDKNSAGKTIQNYSAATNSITVNTASANTKHTEPTTACTSAASAASTIGNVNNVSLCTTSRAFAVPMEITDSTEQQPETAMYTVTFQNYDGTALSEEMSFSEGSAITNLPSEDPVREATNTTEYIFIGWKSSITGGYYATADLPPVTEDVVYTAMYYERTIPLDTDAGTISGSMPGFTMPSTFSMPAMSAMNLSSDQLSILMAQMSDSTPSSYEEVLSALGYMTTEQPSTISLYPTDFDGKERVESLIEDYNNQVRDDADKVTYTDMIGMITSSITTIIDTISYVLMAFVAISLIVSSIMIAIITYISVLERTKEIGILRAIGTSKNDVSKIFNAETVIEGLISGMLGIGVTLLLCIPINAIVYRMFDVQNIASLPASAGIILIGISVLLTLIAGFAPSRMAAKKDPVTALRSE